MALPSISTGTYLAQYDFSTTGLADSAAIASVSDPIGGNSATQATGGNQPLCKTNVQNGLSIGRFDGTDDYLDTPAFAVPATYTIFVVAKSSAGGLPQNVFDSDNQGATQRYFQFRYNTGVLEHIAFNTAVSAFTDSETATVSNFNYLTARVDTTTVQTWVNGVSGGSTALSGTGLSGSFMLRIGARIAFGGGDQFLNGDVGEVVFVSGAVNTTDQQAIEAYYVAKWFTAAAAPDTVYARDFGQHTIGPF